MCWCVDALMCWWLCWCVDDCVDVLMCQLMCWCVDVLMCWCVDVVVDVLVCWCVDVIMFESWGRDRGKCGVQKSVLLMSATDCVDVSIQGVEVLMRDVPCADLLLCDVLTWWWTEQTWKIARLPTNAYNTTSTISASKPKSLKNAHLSAKKRREWKINLC
jgi:hypothetical protein